MFFGDKIREVENKGKDKWGAVKDMFGWGV
jgi:hypothetical protein